MSEAPVQAKPEAPEPDKLENHYLFGQRKATLSGTRLTIPHYFIDDLVFQAQEGLEEEEKTGNPNLVVTLGTENCISIYPPKAFDDYIGMIEPYHFYSQAAQRLLCVASMYYDEVKLKRNGRITLSERLLEQVDLKENDPVLVIGGWTQLNVWNPARWKEYERGLLQTAEHDWEQLLGHRYFYHMCLGENLTTQTHR